MCSHHSNLSNFHTCCLFLSYMQAVINTMCGFGVQTQNYLEANKSIHPAGCADRAVMWIESHLLLVGALALGLALPQVSATLNADCAVICHWQPQGTLGTDDSSLVLNNLSLSHTHQYGRINWRRTRLTVQQSTYWQALAWCIGTGLPNSLRSTSSNRTLHL